MNGEKGSVGRIRAVEPCALQNDLGGSSLVFFRSVRASFGFAFGG